MDQEQQQEVWTTLQRRTAVATAGVFTATEGPALHRLMVVVDMGLDTHHGHTAEAAAIAVPGV